MPSSVYYEILRNLIYRSIQKETRLSERQVSQLQWSQIKNDTIVTKYGRQVKMSLELTEALKFIPREKRSNMVFFSSPSLLNFGESEEMAILRKPTKSDKKSKILGIFKSLSVSGD